MKKLFNRIFKRWSKWTYTHTCHNTYDNITVSIFERENHYTGLKQYKAVENYQGI